MYKFLFFILLLFNWFIGKGKEKGFEPNWTSLAQYKCPHLFQDAKFGTSSHLAYGWYWWAYNKDFDTTNPEYEDLYPRPHNFDEKPDQKFLDLYHKRAVEMTDKYKLNLMWFGFGFCAPEYEENRLKMLAHFYNRVTILADDIVGVTLLGTNEKVKWERNEKALSVKMSKNLPSNYAIYHLKNKIKRCT